MDNSSHFGRNLEYPASSGSTPFRLDEGFSEGSQGQDEHGHTSYASTAATFQQWVMSQNEEARAEIAYEVLRTLRTSNIAAVVERLTPLLHMDPVQKLPPEITSEIFSLLDAQTLLTVSLASHSWRARIFDSRLWQKLFKSQGWGIDSRQVEHFEQQHLLLMRGELKKTKPKYHRGEEINGQPQTKKRATSDWLDSKNRKNSADVSQWREQHGAVEADTGTALENGDQEMQDAPLILHESPSRPNKRHSNDSGEEMDIQRDRSESTPKPRGNSMSSFRPALVCQDSVGHERLDWAYLYKQRQRLEENWNKGRFTNFQLPHPQYLTESHTECVYTIQFYGKWLVSGSRDKTLRVWDLETRRLRGKPLTGHSQSVLCLQFDPTEEEDVIISGSSDSSIIVWKFSTGAKLLEIPSAHEESVLNLRFDHRYLVTCSKDKKIKIWNRHQIQPTDPEWPKATVAKHARVPQQIVDVSLMEPSLLEAKMANGTIKALKPYTHLSTLEGHSAAVNAIQIQGDLIVSASGDRLIKVWSIKDGKCVRTLPGHLKGIACVQFDSKRIVSGSSDNTVRIYDPVSGAEVAVLIGHNNLVRTVQAGFGDMPGSEDDYARTIQSIDQKWYEDLVAGRLDQDPRLSRRRTGSIDSTRITVGSKLPPGGGGSKWGRIVSGSYDETIIIWKQDVKGRWVAGQILRQDTAVRVASRRTRSQNRNLQTPAIRGTPAIVPPAPQAPGPVGGLSMPTTGSGSVSSALNASHTMQQVVGTSGSSNAPSGLLQSTIGPLPMWNTPPRLSSGQPSSSLATNAINPLQAAQNITNQTRNAISQVTRAITTSPQIHSAVRQATQVINVQTQNTIAQVLHQAQTQAQQQQQQQPQQSQQQQTAQNQPVLPTVHNLATVQVQSQAHPQPNAQVQNLGHNQAQAQNPNQPQPQNQNQPQPQNQNQTQNQNQASQHGSVSRVFKLQFDARRIVCCSQDFRIIGWDFANGDPDISAASKFFVGP